MPVLPSSLTQVLVLLRLAFTAPTFQTFEALVAGMIGRVGERTVWGMWQAVGSRAACITRSLMISSRVRGGRPTRSVCGCWTS